MPLKRKTYLLLAPALGLVKIGCSIDPCQRMCDLRTMNAAAVEPLLVLRTPELELHDRFKMDRRQGEWFAVSQGMIDWLVIIEEYEAADRLKVIVQDVV